MIDTHKIFKTTDLVELFNLAYLGVVAQGRASVKRKEYNSVFCAYQDSEQPDCKCGIGHCLTDEALNKVSNLVGAVDTMIEVFAYDEKFLDIEMDFKFENYLMDLQGVHDDAESDTDDDDAFLTKYIKDMKRFAEFSFPNCKFSEANGIEA